MLLRFDCFLSIALSIIMIGGFVGGRRRNFVEKKANRLALMAEVLVVVGLYLTESLLPHDARLK